MRYYQSYCPVRSTSQPSTFKPLNYCLQHIRGEVSEVKYKKGDIVCLFDGRTVYVFDVDNKEKEYQVSNTEEEGTLFTIKENEIFMKIV